MATTWILHTETKGTGAQMVPLESVNERSRKPSSSYVPPKALREGKPQSRKRPERIPRTPHKFRVVNVMTRETLVDGGTTAETLDALEDVRSVVDVNIFVWREEDQHWRPLTFGEQRTMLDLACG